VEIAEVIAHRLGLTGGLGTLVERKDGILTGKLVGKPLHGKAKYKAMKHLAQERNISLKRSYAYSDSHNDLPMLTHVGHPVAINPDKILKTHAEAAAPTSNPLNAKPAGYPTGLQSFYFLLRRWWRVLRSNLRCFFLDIRLRRFLITEPTKTSQIWTELHPSRILGSAKAR
jgi:hypothetical protein